MSKFLDCNGVPLKVGDVVMRVNLRLDPWKSFNGTIFKILGLEEDLDGCVCIHEPSTAGGITATMTVCEYTMKLQDLDDDEILQNNVLFSTTTDTWERITDYPKQPTLEPELVPA